MGLRYRKSFNFGPFRVTASKSGVSTSFGGKGARITKTANGKTRTTLSVPGTGISYVTETGGKKREAKAKQKAGGAVKHEGAASAVPRDSAPAFLPVWMIRLLGIVVIVAGLALCAVFVPVGIAVMAYGVYRVVRARKIQERQKEKDRLVAFDGSEVDGE